MSLESRFVTVQELRRSLLRHICCVNCTTFKCLMASFEDYPPFRASLVSASFKKDSTSPFRHTHEVMALPLTLLRLSVSAFANYVDQCLRSRRQLILVIIEFSRCQSTFQSLQT